MEIASAFQIAPSDDEERLGAYALFPYDRDLVRRFREAFPRARWRGAEERWFVPGTTAVQRLDTWMAQELQTLDRHADAKGRDAFTFDPLESPYLTTAQHTSNLRKFRLALPEIGTMLVECIRKRP